MAAPNTAGFPRELRRRNFTPADRDFLVILLISLFLHIALVLFFKSRLSTVIRPELISEIQKRYAKIVLEREELPLIEQPIAFEPTAEKEPTDLLYTPIPGVGGGAGAGFGEGVGAPGGRLSPEERLPEAGAMAAAGRAGGVAGGRSMGELAGEVGSVGFLGLLTSGSGYVPESYIGDIDVSGRTQNQRMGDILSSLDAMSVARGPGGKGWGTGEGGSGGGDGGGTGSRVARGTRRENRAMSIDDLLGALEPTGNVAFENVDRSREGYENVASSIGRRPDTPQTEEEKKRLRRSPDFVQAVINSHRMAITDCYKQILRNHPGLRGKVEVRLAINAEGSVDYVELLQSNIENREMIDCILQRIEQWNDFGFGDPTAPPEVYRQVFTFGY
ncbi:MAG TPA: AgmX/PglI C-terminal domain-containing protein [bacterium]|nr:AgmX/PglI C-terminal domain-containing protein [bacterium]HNT65534.1 AgmX/PglI C-terminal domain-containing protein [bacterium]HOX87408.1 AgmX/PglI C-terminal domain-containing protein [bacterium]HPG46869.1 AgmX/PglI C-terminal domain-containing protein [bacterium]HPM99151.1 AgmX/PglI C-terminal domain-containing protein [bacterium]